MNTLLPWQAPLWQQLAGRKQHAHAYLFHGPQGIGKRILAERLMALLLCQRPDTQACGQCKACQLLAAGTHPDHYLLEPEEADKPIKVDQVRELVDFVVKTAQLGGRKVVLLEPAEAMNLNAANALLKSLEEPSGDTVLLLVSHQPSRLLPTIRSRCVQQACPQPDQKQSLAWLRQALPELDSDTITALLGLAAGSPLAAQRMHSQEVLPQRALVVEGVKRLIKRQQSPSQLTEAWGSVPLTFLFDWFFDWLHRMLRFQLSGDGRGLGPADMAKVIEYMAGKVPQSRLLALQEWVLEHRQKVLGKANLNRALLLEALLVQWAELQAQG